MNPAVGTEQVIAPPITIPNGGCRDQKAPTRPKVRMR
jgi:hypothetical protein